MAPPMFLIICCKLEFYFNLLIKLSKKLPINIGFNSWLKIMWSFEIASEDIDLENDLIHIRPNPARRPKTENSKSTIPIAGYAQLAMEEAFKYSHGEYLFTEYIKDGKCKADHASAALSKWLKREFSGLTEHCLSYVFRNTQGWYNNFHVLLVSYFIVLLVKHRR